MRSLIVDLRVLYHLALKPIRGMDHAARLESFYAGQSCAYDQFRRRLLHGRQELYSTLRVPRDGIWVDLGGGTGAGLEWIGSSISLLSRIQLVDLSPSLLAMARQRIARHNWRNVEAIEADAAHFRPHGGTADIVTLSYALTMIPDWFTVLENVADMLRPGGMIGVVDFYVSRKFPESNLRRHSWLSRTFWPLWFGTDNVFLSPDHLAYLLRHFEKIQLNENHARIPYLPCIKAPYYLFIGKKRL